MTCAYERNRDCSCERCSRGRIMGGVVLLTLGGLFLLNGFTHIGFHSTWPVLLIMIGVVMVWQHAGSSEGHVPRGGMTPPPPQNPEPPQVPHV